MATEYNQGSVPRKYCRSIASEVSVLEELLSGTRTFDSDMDEVSSELWKELAEVAGENFEEYSPSVIDYITLYCLDIKVFAQRDFGSSVWDVVGVSLLRTYGGPDIRIEWHDSDYIEVKLEWVGESVVEYVFAPCITSTLAELANC